MIYSQMLNCDESPPASYIRALKCLCGLSSGPEAGVEEGMPTKNHQHHPLLSPREKTQTRLIRVIIREGEQKQGRVGRTIRGFSQRISDAKSCHVGLCRFNIIMMMINDENENRDEDQMKYEKVKCEHATVVAMSMAAGLLAFYA